VGSSLPFKLRAVQAGLYVAMIGSQAVTIGKRVLPVLLREIERRDGDLDPEAAKLMVPEDCQQGIGWVSGESVKLGAAFIASLLADDRKRSRT